MKQIYNYSLQYEETYAKKNPHSNEVYTIDLSTSVSIGATLPPPGSIKSLNYKQAKVASYMKCAFFFPVKMKINNDKKWFDFSSCRFSF